MGVEFGLAVPPRRGPDPDFLADPVPAQGLLTEDERRHREVVAVLDRLTELVAESAAQGEGVAAPLPSAPAAPVDPVLFAHAVQAALGPLLEAQGALTSEAFRQVTDDLVRLRKVIVASVSGGSGGGSTGHVTVDGGQIALSQAVALDAVALGAVREALPDAELRATPVPVSGTVTASVSDSRGLTQRMFERSPQTGYKLWMDVTSTDATKIWMAEAPDGTAETASAFQGIQVTLDASGNPLGAVKTATAFRWDQRSSASWSS